MKFVYFYSIQQPLKGVVGQAQLEDGVLTGDDLAEGFINSLRSRNPQSNDTAIFEVLNDNWSNGYYFTLPQIFPGEKIAQYVG
jgi:hypothetical protein